ncbi:hypothetical protein VTN02DRAFT_6005 [Thermoascus thermophilus]
MDERKRPELGRLAVPGASVSGMGRHADTRYGTGTNTQVVLAGGIAGLVSRFVIAPLDVVKIRLQLQIHSLSDPASHRGVTGPVYKGTIPTIRAILREEGVTGLWKGNIPAELMYICYGGVQFATYRSTTQALAQLPGHRRLPPSLESFVAGALAGGVRIEAGGRRCQVERG